MFLAIAYKCGIVHASKSGAEEKVACGRQSSPGSRQMASLPSRNGLAVLPQSLPFIVF